MNLRWVHAVLILLSALLAVVFGIYCLTRFASDGPAGVVGRSPHSSCRSDCRLRFLVSSQDEDAAMTETTHSWPPSRSRRFRLRAKRYGEPG
jgi:hypothetical protein